MDEEKQNVYRTAINIGSKRFLHENNVMFLHHDVCFVITVQTASVYEIF